MTEQPPDKRIGEVLGGRYRILSTLGNGGMSTVYLAEDLRLAGKRWAVKETRPSGEEAYAYLAEAEMLVRLNHPNLPEIVDYYPADREGFSYLVMDYIDGETLLQRFERQARRMPAVQIIGYALQLCDLFQYLHTRRPEPIIYRDLKPSNLMIDMEERLRLIDFGIARSFKQGQAADTVHIGTIGFAAPEQFEGRQTDERTDLYGLGALLYFLLSGGHTWYAARKGLRELDDGILPSFARLVEKLLQPEPEERCQSAAEVRGELQRILAEQRPAVAAGARGPALATEAAARKPRVVVVGALYAGAGATFAAVSIARALHALGVPHAVLEATAQPPELYALLYGEKHAPAGYRCYNDADAIGGSERTVAWTEGCTLWLPSAQRYAPYGSIRDTAPGAMRPAGLVEGRADGWPQLFSRVERPVIVVDIGSDWEEAEAGGLLDAATELAYVVDPLLHKLELGPARRSLRRIAEHRHAGKPVRCIANKAVASGLTAQWLSALPERPACILPALDFVKLAEASWLGVLAQDRPGARQPLHKALLPWLRGWLRLGSGQMPYPAGLRKTGIAEEGVR